MNRPDHIAAAEANLERADGADSWAEASYLAGVAQVHATLALAVGPEPIYVHFGADAVRNGNHGEQESWET